MSKLYFISGYLTGKNNFGCIISISIRARNAKEAGELAHNIFSDSKNFSFTITGIIKLGGM